MSELDYIEDIEKLQHIIETLQQENQQLRIEISAIEEDYKKLEDNWNKLKEYIGYEWYSYDNDSVEYEVSKDILNKMQELEGSKLDFYRINSKNYADILREFCIKHNIIETEDLVNSNYIFRLERNKDENNAQI